MKFIPLFVALALLAGCGATTTTNAVTIPMAITIIDAESSAPVSASVYVYDQRAAENVSDYTVRMTSDGQPHELRVEAPGYRVWTVKFAGVLRPSRRISAPVKLQRLPAG